MPLGFKDFMTVDYRPGEDDLVKYRAHKRRRGQGAGSDAEYASTYPPEKKEALTPQQRIQRSRTFKKNKAKIALGRARAARKMATREVLLKRARKAARKALFTKMIKDVDKSELSFARRQEIEKKLEKPAIKKRIDMMAKRMFKDVRAKEVARKQAKAKAQ
jgi:hypothetical protein